MNFFFSLVIDFQLNDSTDGLSKKVKNRAFFLKVKLFAGMDGRSGIKEKPNCNEEDNGNHDDEEGVDLREVDDGNNDDGWTFDRIDETKDHCVVNNSKIVGKLVCEKTRWSFVEEVSRAPHYCADHRLVSSFTSI